MIKGGNYRMRKDMAGAKKSNGQASAVVDTKRADPKLPFDVGEVIRRLRTQRGLSIRDVADGCGLSQSFLSMVERGDSDISIGRLAKIAEYFDHDLGSLLGYGSRLSKPRFITKFERTKINRGPGIDYEVIRLPGLDFELSAVELGTNRGFKDSLSHEGFDVLYVFKGEVVLCFNGEEYPMHEGDCVYYSAVYKHRLVNRSKSAAVVLGITTGHMA